VQVVLQVPINRGEPVSRAASQLASALRDLHLQAGKPSYRSISRALEDVSHTTVAELLGGRRIPSWSIVERVVKQLGGDEDQFRSLWLEASRQAPATAVAEEISASVGPDRSGDTLPVRNPTFTGRIEALDELEARLTSGPVAVVALRGLGGVGKSQLALEYAHRMHQSGRYRLAGWVRADSPVTIAEDLAALAPLLGLPVEGPVGETAAQVVGALGPQRDWLVVFDNAQKPGDLREMLPSGRGHVLITSRNRAWGGVAWQVDLGEFSRAESVKFLCERSRSYEPEVAADLASELGDLPLALAQAAAYIDTRSMTIRGYLELYRDTALARRLRDAGLDSAEYPASVARTWLLSFTQLSNEHPAAVELLRLCAFLDSGDIDLDLLSAGREETSEALARVFGDRLERAEAAGALVSTSLATVQAKGHLRVHRLVQAVTRDQLDDDQAAEWAKLALKVIVAILPPEPADYRFWPIYAKLAPHIEAVAGHASDYSILAERIFLLRQLGIYLSASGQLRAACTTFERVLAISEAAYGPDYPEVGRTLSNLGEVQLRLGELRDARASIERALVISEAAYGPDHPEVARALGNLGIVQRALWELRDARASIERARAIFQAAYGPDHLEVAKAFVDRGIVQLRLGELRDARASLERGLAISETADRPDHPEVARALTNLGAVQMRQGELRGARASIERALAISEAVYGPDHPGVASALTNLGAVQMRQGELRDARVSLERAQAILQGAYGPDHPEVASALVYLGVVQLRLGELGDARASLERALVISEAVYGPDHPEIATALDNLGIVQRELKGLGDARADVERLLAIF
jgi:Tfp pilus assembly protein PilF